MTRRKVINKILFYIGVIILIIPPIFVFAWMILTALKSGVQNIEYPPLFIFKPTMENFKAVFQQHNFFQYLINSTIIAFSATIISLLVGLPAAYSIVRYNQKKLSMAILIARMTPFISYLLPWYIVFRMLGLIDTFIGMIMTHLIITLPMVIWLMIAFFENVPRELEESAFIDGCSRVETFIRITIPLSMNGIFTAAIISFIFSWNQFLFSLILSGPRTRTVPVAVYNFMSYGKIDWGGIGAAATIIVLPVLVFAFIVRKKLVEGLTAGAIKG